MYSGLLIILAPLIVGYMLPLHGIPLQKQVNKLLGWMVYVILFVMGMGLAFLDDLSHNLLTIFHYSLVSAVCILICNLLALRLLEWRYPWQHHHHKGILPSRLSMALESLTLCGVITAGFVIGLSHWAPLKYAPQASEYALLFLLFLVGLQLRSSGMTVRQIILNRRGLLVASVVFVSALIGGMIAAMLLGLSFCTGLALASGFGWYSLSGILMTESFGPVMGSAAFFNDLLRELLAIMLVPTLITRHRATALGLCGATSMDFTLPVLQRSGGTAIVPAAIVQGFILSLAAPVLIALFSSWSV
ncbi:lysine exporter LysO family protein [Erwinia psidii]|uniref:Lysine exporter LysO family protein n=1 Tax=Erwinia psidii TaxID=69224 RepID=A0A3N6UQH1_9GAMM|nr:lysine exporter LysO family protein [Erwinia psidii]MCX8957364.1 lysine exporter LysO family protein [Erwinia psidii]MCX8964677.1 lysine exporter LysO family protein [Erwinia psidii]RQM38209.1 lysine exporter LysO family protein [Erwinia psidii]